MGISSALYSGVSGLNTNGQAMSVIGNNLANTNTLGFKGSRTIFADLLSGSINGSGGQSQVGRGVGMSKVDQIFSQGTFEATESNLDVAIEGDGFFILKEAGDETAYYSRAGSFRFDENGLLVNPEGLRVQGKGFDADGNLLAGDAADIQVESSGLVQGTVTSSLQLTTNLDSTEPIIALPFDYTDSDTFNYSSSVQVFDTLGNPQLLSTYFTKTADNTWSASWSAEADDGSGTIMSGTFATPLVFTSDGILTNAAAVPPTDTTAIISSGAGTALPAGTNVTLPYLAIVTLPDASTTNIPAGSTLADGTILPAGTVATAADGSVDFTETATGTVTNYPAGTVATLFGTSVVALPDATLTSLPAGTILTADGSALPVGTIATQIDGSIFIQPAGSLNWNNGTTPTDVVITFDTTQFNSESVVISQNQNGSGAGNLTGIEIDPEGIVIASYSNGEKTSIAQLVLGKFVNAGGLALAGSNLYTATTSSGAARTGLPGPELGSVFTNSLEQSNVDMGAEFVRMITVQRGFQANSKIITTVDELLGELINLKR
ncbi:MAG: flagellar hook-basal body complex protein [Desulfobulbaceae bacterium]|nr:flagellar hook-basal body complex protein [Desulfobulbaceae bacterium]